MHTYVGMWVSPNQNKTNIDHIQLKYFSWNASGMKTQMPTFKQSCVNRLGPWQEKGNLF